MRYLYLAVFLAGSASASTITSGLDLTITGTNLEYAGAGGAIDTETGPQIWVSPTPGHAVSVVITLISYVTISGAVGDGTAQWGANYSSCDANPIAALAGCGSTIYAPGHFTFGTPAQIYERFSLGTTDTPGIVFGGISPLLSFNVRDSGGNLVDAKFAFSATLDQVAEVHNPEPATWVLLAAGLGALVATAGRRNRRFAVRSA
jgi:hypothetical protein